MPATMSELSIEIRASKKVCRSRFDHLCWPAKVRRTQDLKSLNRKSGTFVLPFLFQRCGQPTQQHGRRIPPLIFERAFSMRIPRVSAFTPEVTQHIHSFRANGVMSCQRASTFGVETMAFRKSSGSLCTVPVAMLALMSFIVPNLIQKVML